MKSLSRLTHLSQRIILTLGIIISTTLIQIDTQTPEISTHLDSSLTQSHELSPEISLSLGMSEVFAEDSASDTSSEPSQKDINDMLGGIVNFLNLILGAMSFLITPLIALAGWLLSPDWTRGDLFGLNEAMYKIWILVSNVTYFFYAIALVIVAVLTIFNSHDYTAKQMLPKLALGILFVPVSWWVVSAVTSVGNQLTIAVMQIPVETLTLESEKKGDSAWIMLKRIPKQIVNDNTEGGKKNNATLEQQFKACEDPKNAANCLSAHDLLSFSSGPYSLVTVYAYGIFKIQDFQSISLEKVTGIAGIFQIFHQLFFGALVFLIFGILIVGLVFALLLRVFHLWILTMLSPLLSLSIVLKKDGLGDYISFSELIKLAFVPVYVSGALSFGVLLLGLMMSLEPDKKGAPPSKNTVSYPLFGEEGGSAFSLAIADPVDGKKGVLTSTFKLGGENASFSMISKGSIDKNEADALTAGIGFFDGAGGIIGKVIIDVIALVVLWLAMMAAMGAGKITKAAIKPFEGMGRAVGEFGMKVPGMVPIPGLGVGVNGVSNLLDQKLSLMDQAVRQAEKESYLGKLMGMDKDITEGLKAEFAKLNDALKSGNTAAAGSAFSAVIEQRSNNDRLGKSATDRTVAEIANQYATLPAADKTRYERSLDSANPGAGMTLKSLNLTTESPLAPSDLKARQIYDAISTRSSGVAENTAHTTTLNAAIVEFNRKKAAITASASTPTQKEADLNAAKTTLKAAMDTNTNASATTVTEATNAHSSTL